MIIPASLLAESGLSNEVEINLVDKTIVISPIDAPRVSWFDDYDETQDQDM